MKDVQRSIPVHFETVDTIDTRFQKVKIWLMHLGENYNNSIFEKDAVLRAMDSLKNTPILGYVEESRLGEKDFRGHEVELVVEGGELKTKYIGQAFGVIPENCNPRFEIKKGDYDNDLEYLVVDGLMWTKFDDGVNILNTHGEVAQSMELHDDYDGYFNEDGVFVFTRFSFYGACLLGQDVLPAMQKASVEVAFTSNVNVYQEEIARKLEEFQQVFSKKQDKEVEQVMTLTEVILAKYSTTIEELAEKGINLNEYTLENVAELEAKIKEAFATTDKGEGGNQETSMEANAGSDDGAGEMEQEFAQEDEGKDSADDPQNFTLNFELSHDDIRRGLYQGLDEHIKLATGAEHGWNYIVSVFDTYFIAEDEDGRKFHMVKYSKDGDKITLGDVTEVYAMFLTAEEKGALDLMRSSFGEYERENTELKQFKAEILKGQHAAKADELFAQFNKLTAEEISDLRENVHNYTLEEIESKLFERLGRKTANFSANTKPNTSYSLKFNINPTQESDTSGYAHLLRKHGLS